jgi:adenosylcobinamide-GDP ribazoletransferase
VVLTAVRRGGRALAGALGFLSRLPVGRDERSWRAFRSAPWTLPLAGYLLGALLAVPVAGAVALSFPEVTVALAYLLAVASLTGINHFDGVADLGDAAVVHGGPKRRREVMGDTTLGVGGTLALALVVAGLALGGLGLAGLSPLGVAAAIVAAEVGAKAAMAVLVCGDAPAHDGFGAQVAAPLGIRDLVAPLALALPVAFLVPVGLAALAGALLVALALGRWARVRLDGVTGDVFGAGNELARVAALHAALTAAALIGDVSLPVGTLGAILREVAPWALP